MKKRGSEKQNILLLKTETDEFGLRSGILKYVKAMYLFRRNNTF